MATVIKATAINDDLSITSSNQKAALAGRQCIDNAGIDVQDVDILINVGLFRDQNMCEPAMAAMIQKKIGINPDFVTHPVERAAFSFDLMEGACGFVKAIQVGDSLLKAEKARTVLIVSSNAHPSNKIVDGFPYSNVGAAMLLVSEQVENGGFREFAFDSTKGEQYGSIAYLDLATAEDNGRNLMYVHHEPGYYQRLLGFASEFALGVLEKSGVDRSKTILLSSCPTGDFQADLGRSLSVETEPALELYPALGDPHCSSSAISYHLLKAKKFDRKYEQVLFVQCGSGLSAACALYKF